MEDAGCDSMNLREYLRKNSRKARFRRRFGGEREMEKNSIARGE